MFSVTSVINTSQDGIRKETRAYIARINDQTSGVRVLIDVTRCNEENPSDFERWNCKNAP